MELGLTQLYAAAPAVLVENPRAVVRIRFSQHGFAVLLRVRCNHGSYKLTQILGPVVVPPAESQGHAAEQAAIVGWYYMPPELG